MQVELAKAILDFNESLDSQVRLREIIREIHNVCVSDIHFQNDQLSKITDDLEKSKEAVKSKKIVLDESIKAVDEMKKRNKKLALFIDEKADKLLRELAGDF
jgi:polyhydroxyalkanoate synthesis regulator phasin